MKKLFLVPLLLALGVVAFGQNIKVCNALAVPPVTTNCTDYFGVGNWANSPLPMGTITGFTLVSGGSGYSNPVIVLTDPTGAPATITTGITTTSGVITGIAATGSAGYTMPQVTIVDVGPGVGSTVATPTCGAAPLPACGSGALATAVLGAPFTGGIRKFVATDLLPTLPIAVPDTLTFPGSDFYVIALKQTSQKMHADMPPSTYRGYVQLNNGTNAAGTANTVLPPAQQYLGPVILAQKNRPVRVLFKNMLGIGAAGNLFIPTDTTYMGAGNDPFGKPYLQNRATLHLHGGATPWISDGTPHQWTVPVGETAGTPKGVSTANVPDMWFNASGAVVPAGTAGATNDPGQGNMTFYWTNQQGGRLMFYHDHAYGITRLNVYAGEAAGYLLYDPAEETALATATAPGTITGVTPDLAHLIPLVLQDKTFVPSTTQLAAQDPTWAGNFGATPLLAGPTGTSNSGSNGDFWFPHVYMTNQNPADPTTGNGFGRWDYGAWFFPPMTSMTAATPPTAVTVPCTSSAFPGQLLAPTSACPTCGCPITPNPSGTPEGFMDTPVVNGKAYPVLHVAPAAYRFQILAAGNDRSWNLSWFIADPTILPGIPPNTEVAMLPATAPSGAVPMPLCTSLNPTAVPALVIGLVTGLLDASGNPMNGTGLPAGCWPNFGAPAGIPKVQTTWPADNRAGGAPDPRTAGPAWIQIGTEGGLLAAPVVIPPMPIVYEANTRSITITSVGAHGLWLGPAERADVIVDFSLFGGKTLILYNDAPAPAPAIDSRLDYFTNDGDQSPIGGAPNTVAGYGPNTRTVMQVIVDQTAPNTVKFSLPLLKAAFATTATQTGLFKATQPTIIVPEAGYNSAYNGVFSNTYMGISANNLTFTPIAPQTFNLPPCAATAPATCANLDQKAIQELFTLDYGRMNATMGTEVPLTNFLAQTTVPLGYTDWPTELIQQGQTQLWKITHNGVDTHFIHFHLFNVQLINRVGWDGSMRQPDPNELGWKDTVRMNPLEDVLVALQPITPTFPFPLPDSIRSNDVTMPLVSDLNAITGIDPNSGNVLLSRVNQAVNFGWEYVWHCHILGHEENDMMRPIIFQVPPPAPSAVTVLTIPGATQITWTDNSASETSFTVQRSTTTNFLPTDPGFSSVVLSSAAAAPGFNTKAFGQTVSATDTTAATGTTYYYRVRADDNFQPLNPPSPTAPTFQQAAMSSAWVVQAFVAGPSTMLSPAPGSVLPATPTVTFTWIPGAGVSANALWIGTTPGSSNLLLAPAVTTPYVATFTPPVNSTIYVRLFSTIGVTTVFVDYTYKTPAGIKSVMTSPTAGSVLPTGAVTFIWSPGYGISDHQLWVGTTLGANNISRTIGLGTATTKTVSLTGLTPGSTVYVRLYSWIGTAWQTSDSTYTAPTTPPQSTMLTPTQGSTLSANPVAFTWTAGTGVTDHQLWIGTTLGANNVLRVIGLGTATSRSVNITGVATGTTLYVRLYSLVGTTWLISDTTYLAH